MLNKMVSMAINSRLSLPENIRFLDIGTVRLTSLGGYVSFSEYPNSYQTISHPLLDLRGYH